MFGILLIVMAIVGVGALARNRGSSPLVWSSLATIGAVILGYVIAPALIVLEPVHDAVLPNLAAIFPGAAMWAWIGLVALWVRFGIGAGKPGPSGMWTCPECKSLNQQSALFCDACRRPWGEGIN